jgi:hypothetical protein
MAGSRTEGKKSLGLELPSRARRHDVEQCNGDILGSNPACGAAMNRPCILIDFENVQPKALGRLVPGQTLVKVFLGQNQSKIVLELVKALQPFGKDAEYIQIEGSGPDAVDFHIAFYIGEIATQAPGTQFKIISKDKGFDPLVKHLKRRGIEVDRIPEIPEPAPPKPIAPAEKAKTPSTTTKSRAKEAAARLKKATRPRSLATLRSTLMAWFGTAWGEKSVASVLQSLQDSKIVVVDGTKVSYALD